MKTQKTPTKKTNSKQTVKHFDSNAKTFAVGTREGQILASVPFTSLDFKNALLITSVGINVFFLTAWITLQVSQDSAVIVARSLVS